MDGARRTHRHPKFWILRQLDPQPLILTVGRGCRPNIRIQIIEQQIATARAHDQNEVMLAGRNYHLREQQCT